jgi:hypothetical protein
MALEVIGAGFGRTGTLSLKTALEILGFAPCYHMTEVIANPAHVPFWNRAIDREVHDWDELFGNYRATVDWPACYFFAELADFYPNAKVILSLRDPERWYDSMRETILLSLAGRNRELAAGTPGAGMSKIADIISLHTFNTDLGKDNVIAAFLQHNAAVQRRIPGERLLVFDAAQGWEPLCTHLGVPVPDQPFPRVNDREEFKTHVRKAQEIGL